MSNENQTQNNGPSKEEVREISLKLLQSESFQAYAAAGFAAQQGIYGELGKGLYEQAITEIPDKITFQHLFMPALNSDEGGLNKAYIQSKAPKILAGALQNVKVADVYGLMEFKNPLKENYADKYVKDLDEKEFQILSASYLEDIADQAISKVIPMRKDLRRSGLEEIFCDRPADAYNEREAA